MLQCVRCEQCHPCDEFREIEGQYVCDYCSTIEEKYDADGIEYIR